MKIAKKALAGVCTAALAVSCVGFSAFADDDVQLYSFEATSDNVKMLGRTYYNGESLWLSLTAAGVEFEFEGTTAAFTITADSSAYSDDNPARIAFYADGELVREELISKATDTYTLDLGSDDIHTVSLVKLSESENGTILIDEIAVDNENGISPTGSKSHKIEFIGDSITCGYGVDAENQNKSFTTKTEDGTKTYAYKAAQKLDADYSMVSYSGFGVVSGYTSSSTANTTSLVAPYYDKLGFSWWSSIGTISDVEWDFDSFTPDLVVINLGTNDNSYTKGDEEKIAEFKEKYVDLIKLVREKNPDAEILCTLGIMGQELYSAIVDAADEYIAETGDEKVNTLEFDVQDTNDGLGADWHPSAKTHLKAANTLVNAINELYGWELDESVDISVPVDEDTNGSTESDTDDSSSEPDTSSDDSSREDSTSSSESSVDSDSDSDSLDTSANDGTDSNDVSSANGAASATTTSTTTTTTTTTSSSTTSTDTNPTTGVGGAVASVGILALGLFTVSKKSKK